MINVGREQVIAFRLGRHRLGERAMLTEAAATAPQDTPPGSAELALRARAEVGAEDVAAALATRRTLVRVWSLRGAPCLVNAADLPLVTRGLLPDDEESWRARMAGFLPMLDRMGRSASATMELVIEATRDALNGRTLTTRELGSALAPRLPAEFAPWMGPDTFSSFSEILTRAASLTGEFAIAPGAGTAFLRVDQWLPAVPVDKKARLGLVRRYLSLYGPSTVEEFAAWAGVSPHYAARSWALAEAELVPVGAGFVLAEDVDELKRASLPTGVRLLPPDEPYLQGRDRATLAPDTSLHPRIWARTGRPGVILGDGELAGLWRHRQKDTTLLVTMEGTADRDAVLAEAEPYAEFLGCQAVRLNH
ncbi:winged helix DNA-binding domain-containing protein [Nonomuraea typhae]|uniref:Winged helix DNA-binding domain-containing protein n=1 Tax=Nonomuraea typhae TaxID=2603600 RepID=A0ABW7YWT6_9ACTN